MLPTKGILILGSNILRLRKVDVMVLKSIQNVRNMVRTKKVYTIRRLPVNLHVPNLVIRFLIVLKLMIRVRVFIYKEKILK